MPSDAIFLLIAQVLPVVRQFSKGEFGIALGGAHAKGIDDDESDLDLYLFAREVLPADEREALCLHILEGVESLYSWGDTTTFIQTGTDFTYQQKRVECWLRHIDHITSIIAECKQGIVKQEFVTWTVMGFYNHCALSDLYHMKPLDDPCGILAAWKDQVSQYPPQLRQTIMSRHLRAAKFWPDNFHYRSAIERCDTIYVIGIVQQVLHNLIQVIFALNETYFPGDKKLDLALDRLPLKPDCFNQRVQQLMFPGTPINSDTLQKQRDMLATLVREVESLVETVTCNPHSFAGNH
jgi:hypothetical protein